MCSLMFKQMTSPQKICLCWSVMKGGTLRNRGLEKYQGGQDVFNGSTSSECTITMANFSKMGGGQTSFEWCHVNGFT